MNAAQRAALRKAADGAIREPLDVDAILAFGLKARPEVVLALLDALDAAEGAATADDNPAWGGPQSAKDLEARGFQRINNPKRPPPPDPAEIAAVRAWDQLAGISDPVQYEPAYQKARGHVRSLLAAYDAVVRERADVRDLLKDAVALAELRLLENRAILERADTAERDLAEGRRLRDAILDSRVRLVNALAYAQAALDADVAPAPTPPAP